MARIDDENLNLTISGLTSGAEGVGRADGLAVFVPGALPGETVLARIKERKKNFARAELLEIVQAASERISPACGHYEACGGCKLLHAAYGAQLELKREILRQTLRRLGKTEPEIPPMLAAPISEHYRYRAMLHVEQAGGELRCGFFAPASHWLTPARDCLLLAWPLLDAIGHLEDVLPAFAGELDGLRAIALRCSSDGQRLLITFISDQPLAAGERLATALAEREPRLVSLWECSGPPVYGEYGSIWRLLRGGEYLEDEIAGIKLEVAPAAFTQVNPAQTERLYAAAKDFAALGADDTLLDLYSGLGGVGLYMAGAGNSLTGVESYIPAVDAAQRNAGRNGRPDARFIGGMAEEILPLLAEQGIAPQVAVLDPPRAGCQAAALQALAELAPERIVYISCAPATLARDIRLLAELGYKAMIAQPVDMFCHTAHVETVVLMARGQ